MAAKRNADSHDNINKYKQIWTDNEHILAFASGTKLISEVKNVFPNFKQTASRCLALLNALIRIVRSILSSNFKLITPNIMLNILHIVHATCYFLSGSYIVQFAPHSFHILCVGNTFMNVLWVKIYSIYLWPS